LDLTTLGWNPFFCEHFKLFAAQGLYPARVVREDRYVYLLWSEQGELTAEVSGRLRHEARSRSDFPTVGDWVAIQPRLQEDKATIQALLPRKSRFARKVALARTEEQVIAANVDTVFLVSGLDLDLSVRRIERYLTVAWDSGANPVVLLNKADLSTSLQDQLADVEAAAYGVPIHVVSAHTGQGLEALHPYLLPGQTVVFIGSSGVGKSSLINSLLGVAKLKVGAVRDDDSEGRHTTTTREMVLLPGGAMLIDNPGMRELQLWGEEEHLGGSFADVEALAQQCRFHDCQHEAEPGCAVRQALAQGTLDAARYKSYLKLRKELRFLATRTDERARMEARMRSKQRSRWSKSRQKADG
jgi:ribosome biogenesis GTPase / thiamine phosphate phosphatase